MKQVTKNVTYVLKGFFLLVALFFIYPNVAYAENLLVSQELVEIDDVAYLVEAYVENGCVSIATNVVEPKSRVFSKESASADYIEYNSIDEYIDNNYADLIERYSNYNVESVSTLNEIPEGYIPPRETRAWKTWSEMLTDGRDPQTRYARVTQSIIWQYKDGLNSGLKLSGNNGYVYGTWHGATPTPTVIQNSETFTASGVQLTIKFPSSGSVSGTISTTTKSATWTPPRTTNAKTWKNYRPAGFEFTCNVPMQMVGCRTRSMSEIGVVGVTYPAQCESFISK